MAVGDFNGDGNLDVVTPDGVHLGLGDGTFQPVDWSLPPIVDVGLTPTAMVVGDFNGDGTLDVAVALADVNASKRELAPPRRPPPARTRSSRSQRRVRPTATE